MNIYISNLSYSVTDADLRDFFAEYGEVSSSKIITDRETGRSRGFGFVEMPNDDDAQKAIEELNGAEYDGKAIAVSVAKPREDRGGSFNRNRGGGNGGNRGGGGGYNSRRY